MVSIENTVVKDVFAHPEIGRGTILDRWRLPDGTLYLDNAATRPMLPEVAEAMAEMMANNPLNASSQHFYGQKAAKVLEGGRSFFKFELKLPDSGELIFNSGATEGLNMLLKSAYFSNPARNHIVTAKTEHKAVLNTCGYLESIGAEVTYLDVDEWGQIALGDIEAAIRPTTCAVCIMWVNNETGVMTPIYDVGELCKRKDVLYICDTTQGFGKHKLELSSGLIDGVVASAHKVGGPLGVGLVAWKNSAWIMNFQQGGGQENGLRGGTQNVPGVLGFESAYQAFPICEADCNRAHLKFLDCMRDSVRHLDFKGVKRSGFVKVVEALIPREKLMQSNSVIFSQGSACNTGLDAESEVYTQLSLDENKVIRISY